ncbi:Uncharacterised protein [Vibrio cholerae]|nr:Uncharacterised protein [Vibrio cholerae]CSI83956.1 Uncharacterised protein [Vibrio cholerae]
MLGEFGDRFNQARPFQLAVLTMGFPQQFDRAGSTNRATADHGIVKFHWLTCTI